MDDNTVANIAVVVSGGVTLFNGLVNVIIPVWIERNKAKDANAAARLEKIERTTIELLGELSRLSNLTYITADTTLLDKFSQAYSDMMTKYYAWERAIWSKLNSDRRNDVRIMRVVLERELTPTDIPFDMSGYSKAILAITYEATKDGQAGSAG